MNGTLPSAAVRAVLFLLLCAILGQGGSLPETDACLPYHNGRLSGVEDGVLYADKGTRSDPKVYAVAGYGDPDGFVSRKNSAVFTANEVTMACRGYEVTHAEETDDALSVIYVTAVAKTAEEMLETILPLNSRTNEDGSVTIPDRFEGVSENGLRFKGLYSIPENPDDSPCSCDVLCYVEANHGCCVLVMPCFKAESEELLPSREYMLELARTIMTGLTIR